MTKYPVISSNIDSIGYEDGTLEVHFKQGSIYHYYEVPEEIFENLLKVESVGKYFHAAIKPFRYQVIFDPNKQLQS